MATTPIHVFARWKVREGNLQAVLDLLSDLHAQTILEEGNLFYTVNQSRTDLNTLILYEGYRDETAQKEHVNADHYQRLAVAQIVPLLEEREVFLTTPLGLS